MPRKELTAKQERFCQNIEIKKMSQREAYYDAYPKSKGWKIEAVDVQASILSNNPKVLVRCKELRTDQLDEIKQEARWTREDAHSNLTWLLERAKREIEEKGEISRALVTAIVSTVKELNVIFAVGEKSEGGGVLEDILKAVRGVDND